MLELPPNAWLAAVACGRYRRTPESWEGIPEDLRLTREFSREERAYIIRLETARMRGRAAERLLAFARRLVSLAFGHRLDEEHPAARRTRIPGDGIEPNGAPGRDHALSARPAEGDGV